MIVAKVFLLFGNKGRFTEKFRTLKYPIDIELIELPKGMKKVESYLNGIYVKNGAELFLFFGQRFPQLILIKSEDEETFTGKKYELAAEFDMFIKKGESDKFVNHVVSLVGSEGHIPKVNVP